MVTISPPVNLPYRLRRAIKTQAFRKNTSKLRRHLHQVDTTHSIQENAANRENTDTEML